MGLRNLIGLKQDLPLNHESGLGYILAANGTYSSYDKRYPRAGDGGGGGEGRCKLFKSLPRGAC